MAMDPALGMDDVAHRVAGGADGHAELFASVLDAGDLALIGEQKLDVVPAGEAQITVAEFIGNVAQFFDEVGGYEPGRPTPDGIDLGPGLGYVHQHSRFQYLMIFPLAIVLFDNRRQEFVKFRRSNISNTLSHCLNSSLYNPYIIAAKSA